MRSESRARESGPALRSHGSGEPISEKTAVYIAVLTTKVQVAPELGSALRRAAYRGRMNQQQADAAIALLKQLPGRAS